MLFIGLCGEEMTAQVANFVHLLAAHNAPVSYLRIVVLFNFVR